MRRISVAAFTSILLVLLLNACQQQMPVDGSTASNDNVKLTSTTNLVPTRHGPVRGFSEDGVSVFKGVRYGANTAINRFGDPALPVNWGEVTPASQYGPSCPQAQRGRLSLFDSWMSKPNPGMSEDCLFLNVWTPAPDRGKRPVMVWLHGGGFSSGSGSSNAYDGVRLVNRGEVVVVSVNHRLNVFGYLYLDKYGEQFRGSGNAGMLDLVMALEWVRDNIAQFGGDPENVMIFGESGGGWKVTSLMAMDAAKGLFHRAAAQSGPALTLMEAETAATATEALVSELGLDAASIDKMREIPVSELIAATRKVVAQGIRVAGRPVIDGVHLHRHPFAPDAPAQSMNVPLLIGSMQSEMSLLIGASQPDLFALTWETLPAALEAAIDGVDAGVVIQGYRALHPDISAPNLFFEATTDHGVFGRDNFILADRKAAQGGAPVYQYYVSWRSPVEGGKWGATHALDIGFVFDNVAKSASMSGVGDKQQALADAMSEAWLAFARSGNPNHAGLPTWPRYDAETKATMVFDNKPQVVNDPRGKERAVIDSALDK
jgi:para-nitrobenzyl esterase